MEVAEFFKTLVDIMHNEGIDINWSITFSHSLAVPNLEFDVLFYDDYGYEIDSLRGICVPIYENWDVEGLLTVIKHAARGARDVFCEDALEGSD